MQSAGSTHRRTASRHSISIQDVVKTYGQKVAANCPSLTVEGGEFLTLLGPSGSGKTTLLMIIAGFTSPDQGRILTDGRDITQLPPEQRNFGMVFQGYALFPHLTVAENIAFPLKMRGIAKAEIQRRVLLNLERVRMSAFGERLPKQLSGGQQQRVALARSLIFEPDVLLLDEPLSALDRALREEMQFEIKMLHEQIGMTFICVTHDQDEALSMSDRIAVMQDGQIVQVGAPRDLYDRPSAKFVAGFLGSSNFLVGRAKKREPGYLAYDIGNFSTGQLSDLEVSEGDQFLVALRPERLAITNPNSGALSGTVRATSYFGKNISVVVETSAGNLTVQTALKPGESFPTTGTEVGILWKPEDAILLKHEK